MARDCAAHRCRSDLLWGALPVAHSLPVPFTGASGGVQRRCSWRTNLGWGDSLARHRTSVTPPERACGGWCRLKGHADRWRCAVKDLKRHRPMVHLFPSPTAPTDNRERDSVPVVSTALGTPCYPPHPHPIQRLSNNGRACSRCSRLWRWRCRASATFIIAPLSSSDEPNCSSFFGNVFSLPAGGPPGCPRSL